MSEQKENQMFDLLVGVSAAQEQILRNLESIDKRLSNLELKMSRVEKWVALENSDLFPAKENR